MELIRIDGNSLPFFKAYIPSNRIAEVGAGRCCALGAVAEELAVGAVVLEESGADTVTLTSLLVDEKVRGQGFGRALLNAAAQVTAAFGARHIEAIYALPVGEDQTAAFLTKNGFSSPEKVGLVYRFPLAALAECPALWRQTRQDPGSRIVPLVDLEPSQRTVLEAPPVPKALRPGRLNGALNTEYSLAWLCGGSPAAFCAVTGGSNVYEVAAVFAFPGKEAMAVRLIQALARRGAALPGETLVQFTTMNALSARLAEELLHPAKPEKLNRFICERLA